jgi:hypothetical protein
MTGYEGRLLARAEMLEDTDELVQAITAVLAGAQGAGVDSVAVVSLRPRFVRSTREPTPATTRAATRTGILAPGTAPMARSSRRSATPKTRSATGCGRCSSSRNL